MMLQYYDCRRANVKFFNKYFRGWKYEYFCPPSRKMRKTKYINLFFDLDRTLWDYRKNTAEAFDELYRKHHLHKAGVASYEEFFSVYERINVVLWEKYRRGEMTKQVLNLLRFAETLKHFGTNDPQLAADIGNDYIFISSRKTHLYPNAHEVLASLKPDYRLHIITNGFEEVQAEKIRINGLAKYFTRVITSEEAGYMKPDPNIFLFALRETGAGVTESLMIGDDIQVDIRGAKSIGMDQVFVNHERIAHEEQVTFEVTSLPGLLEIL
jgi:putative hydrolase of the HAD superfamily